MNVLISKGIEFIECTIQLLISNRFAQIVVNTLLLQVKFVFLHGNYTYWNMPDIHIILQMFNHKPAVCVF
ncbi:hypothetical protein D3C72_1411040 [compost metagenome]